MKITKRQLLQIIKEEKAKMTKKYDDAKELTGDQDKLPDSLQKAIIDKAEEEKNESHHESVLRSRLRKIIMKECPGGMTGEPQMPGDPLAHDQMDLAPAPDFSDYEDGADPMPCPVKTAAKMKEAGATEADVMTFVNTLIDEFKSGGTTVPKEPQPIAHEKAPVGDGVPDLMDVLGL